MKVIVFSCSEYEVRNYGESFSYLSPSFLSRGACQGRFLCGILADLSRWDADEQLFMQDNRMKSGGKYVYLPGFQIRWTSKPVYGIEDIIEWPAYKKILRKWHRKILKVSSASLKRMHKLTVNL